MTTHPALPGELREDEDLTTALYRAAIGPVSTDYYLALFTAWETAGRWRLRWNTAAGLWTLGWLVFRQLGGIALAYAGALVASALLIFGIGGLLFSWSKEVQMMAFGLWLTVAVVVPGLWGNRWFHQQCRARMDLALAANTDVAQACAQLARQSSPRKRALVIGSAQIGMLIALGVAAMQFTALLHQPGFAVVSANASPQSASGKVKELSTPMPVGSAPAKAPAPPLKPASAPLAAVSAAAMVSAPIAAKPAATALVPALVPATAKSASSPTAKVAATGTYGVNVGLFAKEANAQNAREKLEAAKLQVNVDTLQMKRGSRIRVRVGPYATQAQADAAVTQIRALGLDALAYRE